MRQENERRQKDNARKAQELHAVSEFRQREAQLKQRLEAYVEGQWQKILSIERQTNIVAELQEIVSYANRNRAYRGRQTDFSIFRFSSGPRGKGDGKVVEPAKLSTWDSNPTIPERYSDIELGNYETEKWKIIEPTRIYEVKWMISVNRLRGTTELDPGPDTYYVVEEDRGFDVNIYGNEMVIGSKSTRNFSNRDQIRKLLTDAYLGV